MGDVRRYGASLVPNPKTGKFDYDGMAQSDHGQYVAYADYQSVEARAEAAEQDTLRLRGELAREEADCEKALTERDWAQDCLQNAHIALGGDGEWVGKMPAEMPPDSGDLHYDVPALADQVRARAETAEAQLQALRSGVVAMAENWDRIGTIHGVRQFTGNDHFLFANELRTLLPAAPKAAQQVELG